jgi:hypothetical protein
MMALRIVDSLQATTSDNSSEDVAHELSEVVLAPSLPTPGCRMCARQKSTCFAKSKGPERDER